MTWPAERIEARLPRRITGIEYNDPILIFSGDDWFLKLACPWSGVIAGTTVDWESRTVEDLAWEMIGSSLLSASTGERAIDVIFTFDDAVLTVRPDADEDPWVLSFPDFVAVGGLD